MVVHTSLCFYCRSRFTCCYTLCWQHPTEMRERMLMRFVATSTCEYCTTTDSDTYTPLAEECRNARFLFFNPTLPCSDLRSWVEDSPADYMGCGPALASWEFHGRPMFVHAAPRLQGLLCNLHSRPSPTPKKAEELGFFS